MDNILTALLDESVLGRRPDNINEFWDIWVEPPSLGNKQKLIDIFFEHGDSTKGGGCMGDIRGNVNYGGDDAIDISDLIFLVDYMFSGGLEPQCFEEADMNGSGGIDISDLIHLVDYMFSGGALPEPCPL